MAELGTIRRYYYWSDQRIKSIAAENGIKLEPRWRLNIGTPSGVLVPQMGLTQEPRAPQLHDIATKIEGAIGQLAVEDFVTPPTARFAKGVGEVTFAPYTRWDTDAIAVAVHTKTVSSDGQRVQLCLFGSVDNCTDALPSSPAKPPTWRASSTWAIEEFLEHRGNRRAPIYDDDESIAVETLRVFNIEGMTGGYIGKRVALAEWFAEIYHDVVLDKKRWNLTPSMDLPDPVDRILIGAPLWVRSHG